MGATTSTRILAEPNHYASISLSSYDKIRLFVYGANFDLVVNSIRQIIRDTWGKIQSERLLINKVYQFKCTGYPWSATGSSAVKSRKLVAGILSVMDQCGWELITASDLSRRGPDTSTLFFRETQPRQSRRQVSVLSLNELDKLRLIDFPEEVQRSVEQSIREMWPKGFYGKANYHGSLQFALFGDPWASFGDSAVHSRRLIGRIYETLHNLGYAPISSIDLSKKKVQCSSIFFIRTGHQHQRAEFGVISLNEKDKIRLCYGPPELERYIEGAITAHWPYRLRKKTLKAGVPQFHLGGTPWDCDGDDPIYSRRLMNGILTRLANAGWYVYDSPDLARKIRDKSSIVVWKPRPNPPNHHMRLGCVSFNSYNIIRLIDTPQNVSDAIRQAVQLGWSTGVKSDHLRCGSPELRLRGSPWDGWGQVDSTMARHLTLHMIKAIEESGFTVCASLDISEKVYHRSNGNSSEAIPLDVDSWFIVPRGPRR